MVWRCDATPGAAAGPKNRIQYLISKGLRELKNLD